MRVHCLPPHSREASRLPANLRGLRSGSARATAEALRSKASREKGQQHDLCCPRDRLERGGGTRAHRTSGLPPASIDPLNEKTTPARRHSPGRFIFRVASRSIFPFIVQETGREPAKLEIEVQVLVKGPFSPA